MSSATPARSGGAPHAPEGRTPTRGALVGVPTLDMHIVDNIVRFDDRDAAVRITPEAVATVGAAAYSCVRVLARLSATEQATVGGRILTRSAVSSAILQTEFLDFFADFLPDADLSIPLALEYQHSAPKQVPLEAALDAAAAAAQATAAASRPTTIASVSPATATSKR